MRGRRWLRGTVSLRGTGDVGCAGGRAHRHRVRRYVWGGGISGHVRVDWGESAVVRWRSERVHMVIGRWARRVCPRRRGAWALTLARNSKLPSTKHNICRKGGPYYEQPPKTLFI